MLRAFCFILYRICIFRPPLVYKNFRVFGGFFIGIFGFCPKKPQKSGPLGKKSGSLSKYREWHIIAADTVDLMCSVIQSIKYRLIAITLGFSL